MSVANNITSISGICLLAYGILHWELAFSEKKTKLAIALNRCCIAKLTVDGQSIGDGSVTVLIPNTYASGPQ